LIEYWRENHAIASSRVAVLEHPPIRMIGRRCEYRTTGTHTDHRTRRATRECLEPMIPRSTNASSSTAISPVKLASPAGSKSATGRSSVKALVAALRDIIDVLADAEPADKAELYNELGVTLPTTSNGTVAVKTHPRGVNVRVRGGTRTLTPRASAVGQFAIAA
jgi:hypothetical protein